MNRLPLAILIICFWVLSCNNAAHKTASVLHDISSVAVNDTEQIKDLVRQMYKWHETDKSENDMQPITDAKDSFCIGIDLKRYKIRLNELKNTNLFSDEFLENYFRIAETIDRKLKNKESVWLVGDMSPFIGDASPWCNCQDYAGPWDKIEFSFQSLDSNKATLTWTWGQSEWSKGFSYKIRAVKEKGTWKIAYLQGFDLEQFTKGGQ